MWLIGRKGMVGELTKIFLKGKKLGGKENKHIIEGRPRMTMALKGV